MSPLLEKRTDCPIHVGVTEAGVGFSAMIASIVGIGALLKEGIGDTIRVSLTEDPDLEVVVGALIVSERVRWVSTIIANG